jgi:pimeloyl-ACP methyl ester carboxylesterase
MQRRGLAVVTVALSICAACAACAAGCGSSAPGAPPATPDASTDGASAPADAQGSADAGNEGAPAAEAAADGPAGCPGPARDAGFTGSDAGWLATTALDGGAGTVSVEEVTYLSGGLAVHGVVCHPNDGQRHPVVLYDHGGFAGLNGSADAGPPGPMTDIGFCTGFASNGFAVGASSYRGEDGSQGRVEVCLGEVDDVRALMAVMKTMPYVDPTRFFAFGASHGGCITERLALAEPTLKAAVDVSGPGDWGPLDAWWHRNLASGETEPGCAGDAGAAACAAVQGLLVSTVEGAIGGPPSQLPCAYAGRSPALALSGLQVPTLMVHGTYDTLVDPAQACEKRQALESGGKAVAAWDLDVNLAVNPAAPACGGAWQSGPLPDVTTPAAWLAADHYLLVYEQQGHTLSGPALTQALQASVSFLASRL